VSDPGAQGWRGLPVATRYRPGAAIDRRTLWIAAGWAAGIGIAAGILAHLVGRVLFPIDLLLPAAIGALVGGWLAWVVRKLRLSRPRPVVGLTAGAVVLAMLVQVTLDFRAARAAREQELDEAFANRALIGMTARDRLTAEHEEWLAGWTFWNYLRARVGADDSGLFTGTPPVLGRSGAMALSLFELLIALLIATLWAGRTAVEPACPMCGAWRVENHLGGAAHGVAGESVKRLLAGDAAGAAALLRPPDTREAVTFSLFTCPAGHDLDGGVLRVGEVFWTRRRSLALRRVADLVVTGEVVDEIAAGLGAGAEPET
jgi:hypothetical protein